MMDAEAPELTTIGTREATASRAYLCDCCGSWIAAGDRYRRLVYREEEQIRTDRLHLACPDGVWNGMDNAGEEPFPDEE